VYALKGNFGAWVDSGYPVENKMPYLPPCIEYGVAKPARGIDGFGSDAISAVSRCLVTSLFEIWLGWFSVAGAPACARP